MAEWDIEQAEALFSRFAEKHRLTYEVIPDAPIEVLWEFPAQEGLSMPVTLGLQNIDELNFGVPGFWSIIFPLEEVISYFEHLLDAWVSGEARIVYVPLGGRAMQLLDGAEWKTVYRANCFLPVPRHPKRILMNRPAQPQHPQSGPASR